MVEIEFRNVGKVYSEDSFTMQNINFKINKGEFLVLLGPSGCGKSTILRMTAGLEDISSGEILFNNQVINDIHPSKRNVGMVFQNYALYPHMTVAENLSFPLKIAKYPKSDIQKRVKEVSEIIDLHEYLHRKPKELSGGQRQRVALGRAIARNPQLFLFDEPLSNLDAKLRVQMRNEIINLHRKLGTTSIYVTHDQTEAMTMADRMVILKNGVIQQIASPDEMYRNPVNSFVAGFIGSPQMNFFEGKIIIDNGLYFIENNSNLKIKLENQVTSHNGNVTLGLRPEDIKISNVNETHAIISNIEFLGHEKLIYFVSNNSIKCIRVAHENTNKIGDRIALDTSLNQYLFDMNGDRILK